MTESPRGLRAIVLGAIVLCIVASLTGAHAGQDTKTGIKIAVVNAERVASEYKFTVATRNDIQKKNADIITTLQAWDQYRLLPEADQKTLADYAVLEANKTELNGDQKSKRQKLQDQNKRLFDEYLALQTKQALTADEQSRLKELNRLEADTKKRIADSQQQAQDELQKKVQDSQIKVDKDVRDAIVKYSKDKGFNLVFSSSIVLYADNDITQPVLDQLNKQ